MRAHTHTHTHLKPAATSPPGDWVGVGNTPTTFPTPTCATTASFAFASSLPSLLSSASPLHGSPCVPAIIPACAIAYAYGKSADMRWTCWMGRGGGPPHQFQDLVPQTQYFLASSFVHLPLLYYHRCWHCYCYWCYYRIFYYYYYRYCYYHYYCYAITILSLLRLLLLLLLL